MDDIFEFPPPKPPQEGVRLRQLTTIEAATANDQHAFDRITQLGALTADSNLAWFGLLGDQYLRFRSRRGFELDEMNLDHSLCAYTAAADEVLMVEDVNQHPFFAQHEGLEKSPLALVSYLGVPVHGISSHDVIGVLAVADRQPRSFDDRQRRGLELMRDELESQLRLNVLCHRLHDQRHQLQKQARERRRLFDDLRNHTMNLAGSLRSDARFVERISERLEIAEAARDIVAGTEKLEELVEMAEGYVTFSSGQLKLLASQLGKLANDDPKTIA